jgi:hypothetical protein
MMNALLLSFATRSEIVNSRTGSFGSPRFGFRGFLFSIFRWCVRFERTEKASGDACDFIDCRQEWGFVGLRRFVKTADFSHELQGSIPNLFRADGRLEIEKCFDISAHWHHLKIKPSAGRWSF